MSKKIDLTCVDPRRYAKLGETLRGRLPLSSFSLPAEVLVGSEDIQYEVKFGVDSEEYIYIQGFIEAVLQLQCQRCLKPVEFKIHSDFKLSPVEGGKTRTLPERYEAVVLEQEKLSLLQLVEDELILNLPIAPMHDKDC